MSEITNFFDKNFANAIKLLKEQHFDKFTTVTTDLDRITILYPHLKDIFIKPLNYGKNFQISKECKERGVSFFSSKQYKQALKCFSLGILKCPQNSEDELTFKAILIANRSATLYELAQYDKCLQDIDYTLSLNSYPSELSYKLYLRKVNCYQHLKNQTFSTNELEKLVGDSLNRSKLDAKVVEQRLNDLKKKVAELKKRRKSSLPPTLLETIGNNFRPNKNFKNASQEVDFDYSENLGRFAKAKTNIPAGTVIINEESYCAVLEKKFWLTNCTNCMLATVTPVSCPKCANIVFCSIKCLKDSSSYHSCECGLHPTLASSGASINCYMSLRIITQHPAEYFQVEKFDESSGNNTNHYSAVYSLCRNENLRKDIELFHYTIMAVYLLKLLQATSYFQNDSGDLLTETEALIGSLILRNLQILQFNAHEVSELQESTPGPLDLPDEPAVKANYIGGGLYPTLALFNHSCDPGVVRFNIGSRMIVKTIRPVAKGEPIYENYGPIYTNVVVDERKKFLSDRYWFSCSCTACEENWPLFKNMSDDVVKLICQKCHDGYVLMYKDLSDVAFACVACKQEVNVMVHLKALSKLESVLVEAEELYKKRKFTKATNLFLQALTIYCAHTRPPFPDWIKVQQRLRTCFVIDGNKCIDIDNKYLKI